MVGVWNRHGLRRDSWLVRSRLRRWVGAGAAAATASAVVVAGAPTASARPDVTVFPTSVVAALPTVLQRPATTSTEVYLPLMRRKVAEGMTQQALGRDVSVFVADLETGTKLLGRRGANAQIPASNMKSATALAVLSARGADFRPVTSVRFDAATAQLTIVGGGDPLLDSDDLEQLATDTAAALELAGVPDRRIRLRVDDSLFEWPTPPTGWPSSYYTAYADRPFALTRRWASVADGALDAGRYFLAALRSEGLRMGKKAKRAPAGEAPEVAQFAEHTIADAVRAMMPPSDNSIAENLIRHVAVARGLPTSAAGSAAAAAAELTALGIPMRRVRIVDGSGLSASNRLTAAALTAITRTMMDPARPGLSEGLYAMPRAGVDGTLSSRFNADSTRCARNRIMAKTGTLRSSVALSGIAAAADGRPRVFSILVNYYPSSTTATRYWVDRIATAIAGCG